MTLWIVLAAMTALAVAALAVPLLRRPARRAAGTRRAANLGVYRDRVREIDADFDAGLISAAEAETAKNELAANLLADERGTSGEESGSKAPVGRRSWWALAVVVVLVPTVAGLVYWQQGSAQAYLGQGQNAAGQGSDSPRSAAKMVAQLKAHLASQPDDVQGWAMLGRAQSLQNNYTAAAKAFAHANALSGSKSAELLVAQGQALALAAHGDLTGKATRLFHQALKLDPNLPQALFYTGLSAYQPGDYAQAVKRWQALYKQKLPDQFKALIRPHLNAAREQIGLAPLPGSSASNNTSASNNNTVASQPSSAAGAQTRPGAAATAAGQAVKIPVHIALAPALTGKLNGDTTVFVFARAHHGPKMPLAVVRTTVKNLPQTIVLADNMSMVPGLKLSSYHDWDITARVSRSGQATAAKGDYQAQAEITQQQLPTTVKLRISKAMQ
ncbi:MAG TPA: c-type cytochrome biogenesis protein CcmI [Gammaproteobacteria bacterium]|nr:c-type cytochrome biogenesis protein CcmI [Gammaproteobacteria bacterium]